MSTTYRIDRKNRIIFARNTGSLSPENIINIFDRILTDPLFTKGMPIIVDLTEATLTFGYARVEQVRNHVNKSIASRGDYRCAIVTSNELTYGTVRQYSALMASIGIEVNVFKESEQALEWIKE